MKVILRQTVENLGRPGDIVKVKPGYAHNYLIPQLMALPVTEGNIKRIEHEKRILAIREAKLKEEAEQLAARLSSISLRFTKKSGLEGVLYGSVTSAEIAEALEAKGYEIDRKRIMIAEPIKRLGEFEIKIRLHPEVAVPLMVSVLPEEGSPIPTPSALETPAEAEAVPEAE